MLHHLHREIDAIKRKILGLSALVEESVSSSVRAIDERDEALAQKVIDRDSEIDEIEVEVEEDCLKILALHQPVAIDLRFIIAVLKINNDLERIGDLAVNIAERAISLASMPSLEIPFDLQGMSDAVRKMLRESLDALVNLDPALARRICIEDDTVDAMNRRTYEVVNREVQKSPAKFNQLLPLLSVSRNLERIADHATNIAEDVIYMTEGEIVRHRFSEEAPKARHRAK